MTSCNQILQTLRPNGPDLITIQSWGTGPYWWLVDGYGVPFSGDWTSDPFLRWAFQVGNETLVDVLDQFSWYVGDTYDPDCCQFSLVLTSGGIYAYFNWYPGAVYSQSPGTYADPTWSSPWWVAFIPDSEDILESVKRFRQDPESFILPESSVPAPPPDDFGDRQSGDRLCNPYYWGAQSIGTPLPTSPSSPLVLGESNEYSDEDEMILAQLLGKNLMTFHEKFQHYLKG